MARYLDPKADLTFKRVFGEHPELLISFLNSLLPFDAGTMIESIEYLPSEQPPDNKEGKNSIVEVRCMDNFKRKFIVEMQVKWSSMFRNRTILNSCKTYARQAKKGEEYKILYPVYTLVLLNSNSTFDDDKNIFYHHYKVLNTKDPKKSLPGLEYVFVELQKFNPDKVQGFALSSVEVKKMAVLWLRFLTEVGEDMFDLPKVMKEDANINLAADLCKEGAFTPEERAEYDAYWDAVSIQRGLASEMEEAKEAKAEAETAKAEAETAKAEAETAKAAAETAKAAAETKAKAAEEKAKNAETKAKNAEEKAKKAQEKAKTEIALQLLKLGTPIEHILISTGLSEQEINKLII